MKSLKNIKLIALFLTVCLTLLTTACVDMIQRKDYIYPETHGLKLANGKWVPIVSGCDVTLDDIYDHIDKDRIVDYPGDLRYIEAMLSFGCATRMNLAGMVADPQDLKEPLRTKHYPANLFFDNNGTSTNATTVSGASNGRG